MEFPVLSIEDTLKLPGALLWRASKLWQSNLHAALADLGLSSTNAVVLSNILHLELEHKKITQARLAALCSMDRMTASTILRALTEKGFIERKIRHTDKRGFELSLTHQGREVAHEALRRIATVHQKFFDPIDKEELAQLTAGLSKLLDTNDVNRKILDVKNKEKK